MELSELNTWQVFKTGAGRPCVVKSVQETSGVVYVGVHLLDGKPDCQYVAWEKLSEIQIADFSEQLLSG